jgi:hypothetical protein
LVFVPYEATKPIRVLSFGMSAMRLAHGSVRLYFTCIGLKHFCCLDIGGTN